MTSFKIVSSVGQSLDPSGVTMLDSVKVYTKTKETFGWPDDPQEEIPSTPGLGTAAAVDTETEIVNSVPPLTAVDKYDVIFHLLQYKKSYYLISYFSLSYMYCRYQVYSTRQNGFPLGFFWFYFQVLTQFVSYSVMLTMQA